MACLWILIDVYRSSLVYLVILSIGSLQKVYRNLTVVHMWKFMKLTYTFISRVSVKNYIDEIFNILSMERSVEILHWIDRNFTDIDNILIIFIEKLEEWQGAFYIPLCGHEVKKLSMKFFSKLIETTLMCIL